MLQPPYFPRCEDCGCVKAYIDQHKETPPPPSLGQGALLSSASLVLGSHRSYSCSGFNHLCEYSLKPVKATLPLLMRSMRDKTSGWPTHPLHLRGPGCALFSTKASSKTHITLPSVSLLFLMKYFKYITKNYYNSETHTAVTTYENQTERMFTFPPHDMMPVLISTAYFTHSTEPRP